MVDKGDLPPLPPSTRVAMGSHILNPQWEVPLQTGGRIHVVEYNNHYELHWDETSPLANPIAHLRKDSPEWYEVLVVVLSTLRRLF